MTSPFCQTTLVVLQPHHQYHGPDSTSLQSQYHQYFSSHGTCSASFRAKVSLSARAAVQGKSSEREGGRDYAQGAKGGQGTTAGCCYVTATAVAWMKNTHSKCPLRHCETVAM